MKVVYTINTPGGLGADRWIYEGYRHAFVDTGHDFFDLVESDDFPAKIQEINPNILMLDFSIFERKYNKPGIALNVLRTAKDAKAKIFCQIAFDDRSVRRIKFIKRCLPYMDIFYSSYAPEVNEGFESVFKRKLHFVPFAANSQYYFPQKPKKELQCDIAFVGSYYTDKKKAFRELLLPLKQKYNVKIYGSGWTKTDKVLRFVGGASKKIGLTGLSGHIDKKRLRFSSLDEARLYASAKICINIHESYDSGHIKGFSNEREFKIPASGGFQITDYLPTIGYFFQPNKEIVMAKDSQDWFKKIDYYLKNDKERKKIRKAGTKRALKDHTYHNRVKQIIGLYESTK